VQPTRRKQAKENESILKPKLIVKDKIYVPQDWVDPSLLDKHYSKRFYDQASCSKCEYREDRHGQACEPCPAYKGRVVVHNTKRFGEQKYVGFPIGDKKNAEKKLEIDYADFKILDKRYVPEFKHKIKFLLTLRPYQVELTDNFIKRGAYGFMVAPPRSGKTASMLYISLKMGLKTLVIASQVEYLQQYLWHIEGNAEKGIPKCTNLPELEKKVGHKLYGFPKTEEDYENFEIMFMTYQSFLSEKGKGRLKSIIPHVGMLQIDEADQGSAKEFATVIGAIPSRYKLAATGTVDRKDKKDWVMRQLVGPVISEIKIDMLIPKIVLHPTGIGAKKRYNLWVYAMQFLSKHKERNAMIVEQVVKDLKVGHSVVIPVSFKLHISTLVEDINKAWGSKIAEPYVGRTGKDSTLRADTLARVDKGETRVIVGIRRLVQRGLNVPRWSSMFYVIPSSNESSTRQEFSRVLTPMAGKNQPVIRMFYDELGQSKGCARNTLRFAKKTVKAFVSKKSKELASQLLSSGKKKYGNDESVDSYGNSTSGNARVGSTLQKALGRRL
jgi:superfamily II DNA or RNA helicase